MTKEIKYSSRPYLLPHSHDDRQQRVALRSKKMVFAGALIVCGIHFIGGGVLNAQGTASSSSSNELIQEAIKARQQSRTTVEKFKLPQDAEQINPYRSETERQIRNQIDLMKQLNSTMDRTKNERNERISNIRTDIQLLMLELKKIKDAKDNPAPRINQASIQKTIDSNPKRSPDANPGARSATDQDQNNGLQDSMPKSATDSSSESKTDGASSGVPTSPFNTLTNDPVDKLGLANNLVAIGSYQTATQILLELSKDEVLDETTRNWVHFQLGRCYLGNNLIPEAKEAFRKSAESIQSDIAQRTSKWWLEQLESQLSIDDSLNKIQETITKMEAKYGSNK